MAYEEDISPCEEVWELIKCGGYNAYVDEDIIKIMSLIGGENGLYVSNIAIRLDLPQNYVELVQYILCSLDYAEYGTSPRGCWLTKEGKKMLEKFKKRAEGE